MRAPLRWWRFTFADGSSDCYAGSCQADAWVTAELDRGDMSDLLSQVECYGPPSPR